MTIDIYNTYEQHLTLLRQGADQDLGNVFIRHGIMLLFCQQFELAKQLLQACLIADGQFQSAVGSAREIVMDAYEAYVFIDEDLWLQMLDDIQHIRHLESDDAVIDRILQHYLSAFELVLREIKNDKKSH